MARSISVEKFMRSRRAPVTVEQVAQGAGVSDSTARNYLTEEIRLERWLNSNERIVVLHGDNGNSYCVRSNSEIKPTMQFGRSNWTRAESEAYKAHYTRG